MSREIARPKLVTVISIIVGLMAVSNIVILSFTLVLGSRNPALRSVIESASGFDWFTLYVLSAILLVSMVSLFRLRRRAVSWFAVYTGLGSFVGLGYAVSAENPPFFDELVGLGGLLVALALLGYMLRLRSRHVLT